LLVPVLAVMAFFAAIFFVIADRVTPLAATHVERIMAGELGRGSSSQYFARHRQWFHVGDKFVRVGGIDSRTQSYFDVSIVELDGGHVRSRTTASEVHAIGSDLVGSQVTTERYPNKDDGDLELRELAATILPLERNFNLFLDLFSRPQNMHLSELADVFVLRARHGYDPRIYVNEYWGRIASPFTAFALTLLGATYAYAARVRRSLLFALVELLVLTLCAFALRQSFRALPIVPVVLMLGFAAYRLRLGLKRG
jgi:lipopolysaccharide export LptBFGC system permease protein LptF